MANTINQRIALEGSDDIKRQFAELASVGEKAFKAVADAADKTKFDTSKIEQVKQSINGIVQTGSQLASKFGELAQSLGNFGSQGAQAAQQVTSGLAQTNQAAQQTSSAIAQIGQSAAGTGESAGQAVLSAATKFGLAASAIVLAIGAIAKGLSGGATETAKVISDQADKLKITVAQWLELRAAVGGAGGSFEDFVGSAGKAGKVIAEAQGQLGQFIKSYKVLSSEGDGAEKTVTIVTGSIANLAKAAGSAGAELFKLGVSQKALSDSSPLAALKELAAIINKMPDGLAKTAAGVKFFGDNWKDTIKILADVKAAIEGDPLKASRELTAGQVKALNEAREAWEDFGKAVRATRDLIGALLSGGSQARAEWLTKIVDQSRELLKTWLSLSGMASADFLSGLGNTAAEVTFKTLVALGEQLSGIWRDVLVPAGQSLAGLFKDLAGSMEGVSSSQVAAFFISAAVAAAGLAVALKGIGFVLAPFTALLGVLGGFSPILIPLIALVVVFWDKIKEGAASVAALVPNSLAQIQEAFQQLFKGDFAGFWRLFSEAAVSAIETIVQAIGQRFPIVNDALEVVKTAFATTAQAFKDFVFLISGGTGPVQTPWAQELVAAVKEIGKDLPNIILIIVGGFLALHRSAVLIAPLLSRIFGREVTGGGVILLGLIGSMTGVFTALAVIASTLASTFTVLGVTFGILAAILGGPAAAAIAVFLVGLGAIVFYKDTINAAIDSMVEKVKAFFVALSESPGTAFQWITDKFNEALAAIGPLIEQAKSLFASWVTTPIGNAWQWIVDAFNGVLTGIQSVIEQGKALIESWVTTPVANAWQWIKDMLSNVLSSLGFGGGSSGGSPDSHASGGLIGGRGTGTSDSNLAWVSRGEHIMPARAVQQPGVLAFLEALRRSGGNLSDVLDRMGHFAMGGLVRSMPVAIPAFAGGGSMSNVTIQFPGLPDIVGLRGSSSVVDDLRKAASMAQIRSGGRKPSRFG